MLKNTVANAFTGTDKGSLFSTLVNCQLEDDIVLQGLHKFKGGSSVVKLPVSQRTPGEILNFIKSLLMRLLFLPIGSKKAGLLLGTTYSL